MSEKARISRRKQRNRHRLKQIKLDLGCKLCGYNKHPAALSFHHRDPATKNFNIAHAGQAKSWSRLEAEISLCDVLCENCHRELEAGPYVAPDEL